MSKDSGFTLLELIIVIAILGGLLAIVAPKLPFLEDFSLNSEARRAAGLFRHLNESASAKKVYYRAWVDPERDSIKVEVSETGSEFKEISERGLKGLQMKEGVDIIDITVQGLGKVDKGSAGIIFNPGAGAEPFNLHLKKKERVITISYNPYSGRIKTLEGYF